MHVRRGFCDYTRLVNNFQIPIIVYLLVCLFRANEKGFLSEPPDDQVCETNAL